MEQRDASFKIKKENFDKALLAIKELVNQAEKMRGGRDYSWVINSNLVNARTVWEAMDEWRWETEMYGEDIGNIYFVGEKIGDDKVLFDAIAPFVEDGSFIEMQGEDGALWRWLFNDGKCTEQYAKIDWD